MRRTVLLTIGAVILVGITFILGSAYSGLINVSARGNEGTLSRWFLTTVRDRSIRNRSSDIIAPALGDSTLLAEGFEHYNDMCVTCHGAPGREPDELAQGLNPPAPLLAHQYTVRSPEETFWIIKNGVKMTGMAAFGPTHPDSAIWGMVALVRKLSTMTPEAFRALQKSPKNKDVDHMEHMEHHH